jgi:hypothetical protein
MEQTSTGITTGGNIAMVAVRATVLSAVRQPVTTTKLWMVVAWQRPREVVSANTPAGFDVHSVSLEAPGSHEFEEMLGRMDFPQAETGRLSWLVDGAAFITELDRIFNSAWCSR